MRRGCAQPAAGWATPEQAIGVAGTITSLAALDLGLAEYDPERVHGHRLTLDGVQQQLSRLASMPLAERREVPALDPDRAPVIVAGAVILHEVLAHFGLEEIEASERDILHGRARGRRPAGARRRRRPARRLHLLLRLFVLGEAPLQGSRERTPRAGPVDDGHTLGAVLLEELEACSTGRSASIVQCGSSAISASGVAPGSRPVATTSRTSVFRVTTPTSRPSSHTNTARTSGREAPHRLLRGRVRIAHPRVGDHRLADNRHG